MFPFPVHSTYLRSLSNIFENSISFLSESYLSVLLSTHLLCFTASAAHHATDDASLAGTHCCVEGDDLGPRSAFQGTLMGYSWDIYGIIMECLWNLYGIFMEDSLMEYLANTLITAGYIFKNSGCIRFVHLHV